VRVVSWVLAEDGKSARRAKELLTGLPVAQSGRHSGCRMALDATGALLVGTGDTAVASIPQDRTSLGGKVLRVSMDTGEGLPDNPFASSSDPNERRVLSYGHRNIQGIALDAQSRSSRPSTGPPSTMRSTSSSPAPTTDGTGRGGESKPYDESVPMTDLKRFPDAVLALWTSGDMTEAICCREVLRANEGPRGTLVVTALKGAKSLFASGG
jgi:hypothetical protein